MPKKIYDVKPPKLTKKTEKDFKKFLGDEEKQSPKIRVEKKRSRYKKESKPAWVPFAIGGGVVVVLLGVYLFLKLPKATIQIWPNVEVLSFEQVITADKSAELVDSEEAVIPAQYFETSKTETQDFPATGNASNEGRATGTITIYNKYNPPSPLTLKAGTHFMSDSGKLFIASKKIVVPAAKKVGSKITPGSVQVDIQAVEGGESYNIAPSAFIVPGLKGTAYYYSISAESSKAMTGGYAGKVKKVTDDDISEAKDVLTKKIKDDSITELKGKIPAEYVLLDNAILWSTSSASTQTKSGTVADNFSYSATIKASALAFKKSDLDQFAKEYIISQLPTGKALQDDSYKIDYSASTVDVSGGKVTLNLSFSSGIYQSIDKNSTTLTLLGKNSSQINETINGSMGSSISKIKINFWPFWVTSAPNSQKAVNVELKFN
jgi:hypothetical protein